MALPFEFFIEGPPVSQQARLAQRRELWKRAVRNAAEPRWNTAPPEIGPVAVAITYFFTDDTLDIDNIPKLILDALIGLVYVDDRQVTDLLCRKRDLSVGLDLPNVPLEFGREEAKPFLRITATHAPDQEVALW